MKNRKLTKKVALWYIYKHWNWRSKQSNYVGNSSWPELKNIKEKFGISTKYNYGNSDCFACLFRDLHLKPINFCGKNCIVPIFAAIGGCTISDSPYMQSALSIKQSQKASKEIALSAYRAYKELT